MGNRDTNGGLAARSLVRWLTVSLVIGVASLTGVLGAGDRFIEDGRSRLALRPASGDVIVVAIDARSLEQVGVWPWPREVHAQLIRRLLEAGVNEIGLDVDFSQSGPGDGDAALRDALAAADGAVVLPAFLQPSSAAGGDIVLSRPIEPLRDVSWQGLVNVNADPGGLVRSVNGGIGLDGVPYPSMAELIAGVPPPAEGEIRIDYSIFPQSIPRLSAADLLTGKAPVGNIAGRKVIVGATAIELGDNLAVPVHGVLTGPIIQAMAVETLLQKRVIRRAPPVVWIAAVVLVAAALVLAEARLPFRRLLASAVATVGMLETLAFAGQTVWAVAFPTFAVHLAVATLVAGAIARELDRRHIFGVFAALRGRNRERLLERIIQDAFDGIVIVSASETVLRMNSAARRILGGESGLSLAGRPLSEALSPALAGQVLAALRLVSRDPGRPLHMREICVTEDGAITCYLDVVVTRSAMEGEEGGEVFAITLRNVTERRQAELETEALAQQAFQVARSRSAFIFALAHELRAPLEAIAGLAERIAAPGAPPPMDEAVSHSRIIAGSARDLLAMAEDILDLSRIERGDIELDLEPVEVGQLFADLAAMFPAPLLLVGRDIRFEAGNAAACIACDRRRLRQAIVALVTGMIARVPRQGAIVVTARTGAAGNLSIAASAETDMRGACDGPGVELGLAIVDGLVKAHGGSVAVNETPGRLVVVIELPLDQRAPIADAA